MGFAVARRRRRAQPPGANAFVYGHQVNNVARFAPVGGCGRLVCRKVYRVQHVTEKFVTLRGKKAKGAVVNPVKPHLVAKTFDFRFPLAGLNSVPKQCKTSWVRIPASASAAAARRFSES
jgi:hypothetical protein